MTLEVLHSVQALVKALAEPLSEEGRRALATIRADGDAELFDALLGETVIEEGKPDVRGLLRRVCHRSITTYDGLYDTDITDSYVYAQPLVEVLAAAPPGSRAAELRDSLTSLRLLYSPPTTFPSERVDLRCLTAFPRLEVLEVEYPCEGGLALGSMARIDDLSLTRGFDELVLPPRLTKLRLFFPRAASAWRLPVVPLLLSVRELTLDAPCAEALAGAKGLLALRSLTFLVSHGDTGEELTRLLSRVSPTLETLQMRGVTAPRVHVPARLRSLQHLSLTTYHLTLDTLPELRSASIAAWDRLEMSEQPALRELSVYVGTDLRALSACPALEVLTLDFFLGKPTGLFPPDLPALRELRVRGGGDLSSTPCYPSLEVIMVDDKASVDTLPDALRPKVRRM